MTNNTVIISNGNFADFDDLIDTFIAELDQKYGNGVEIKTITEDYTTFSKYICFTTDFTVDELLALDSVRKLADTFIYNGKEVIL